MHRQPPLRPMLLSGLLAASVLLSGCAFGECGIMPDAVVWEDPAFYDRLGELGDPWVVEFHAPEGGLPLDNPAPHAAYGASTLRSLEWRPPGHGPQTGIGQPPYLFMAPPRAAEGADPDMPAAGNATPVIQVVVVVEETVPTDQLAAIMTEFLEHIAVGPVNATADAWLASGVHGGHRELKGERVNMTMHQIVLDIPLRLDDLFYDLAPEQSVNRFSADGWSFAFEPAYRTAVSDHHLFRADKLGKSSYEGGWEGEVPEKKAFGDFERAYLGLDVGPLPEGARLHGMVC